MKDRFGIDWTNARGTCFWKRPHLSRRLFFRQSAAALGGYTLLPTRPQESVARAATPIANAKFCVFVLMTGAPSHIDSFDLKVGSWLPTTFNPTPYDGVMWPQGLFPKLGETFDNIALVRSIKPWAAVHGLAQDWVQMGRNPTAQLSKVAPHIGSVVALEMASRPGNKTLPGFIALNTTTSPAQGYLAPDFAPFYVGSAGNPLPNTSFAGGQAVFERRFALTTDLDAELRGGTLGARTLENELVNTNARKLMYNADITKAFTVDATDRVRYGNTSFGNACITARNLIRADLGTRFMQINVGSWDFHANIYQTGMNPTNVNSLGRQFDSGLGNLIQDLRNENLLDQTLVVAMGEFGRTIGVLNTTAGRDHFLQQSALFAGAGIRGRRAIGATDDRGAVTLDPGWSRQRDIRAEDIEATIYSALGIDYKTIRRDDPFGRGFEYVPQSGVADEYAPIQELWG